IDTSLKNNLTIKNEKLRSEYQEKLIKSATNISKTNVFVEAGRINSSYIDNRFGVSQSFSFPSVYSNQKNVLKDEWKTALLSVCLKESEIRKLTTQIFYTILFLREKEKLLLRVDSNYVEFLKKTNQRFKSGESNILEKATVETQRGAILIQLNYLQQEIEVTKLQFQLLLNSKKYYEPVASMLKIPPPKFADSSALMQHPVLQILQQQKVLANSNIQLERSRLLPDISLGYFNMSMWGTGADNVRYTGSTRFGSAQFGVGIPLFFGSQKSKINAAKTNGLIAENEYVQQQQILKAQMESAMVQYKSSLQTVNYFEQIGLPNAILITQTASKQFAEGEINYLEWVMLINQSVAIQNNYLDALKLLNENIISINFLTSNK
ncbi:MAG: TolC family protein, partial [Bacteroidia bacterium]